ncbi:hypothetical protein [Serratia proteamaculans]|uniref:MrpH family fimbial adhesin n=1 Tax=Serratia proteamaculans TaxID=28151 RepID=UPI0024BBBA2C|nr:hypothetical protein [Serratia proteamaculans]
MPILRYILFGLLLLVSSHTQGASLSYITKVEDSNAGAKNIWFTIAYADENDATPNPCYGAAYCKYAFMVGSKRKIGGRYGGMSGYKAIRAEGARNIGEVITLYKAQRGITFPYSSMMRSGAWFTIAQYSTELSCFGLYRILSEGLNSVAVEPVVGASCGIVPLPLGACKLVGDIVLDHGTINSDRVDGNQTSTTAYLECNQAMSIKVTATGMAAPDVTLRADGSLSSSLQVNGIAGKTGATVDVPANTRTPVKFTSVLKTKGTVAAGPFTGSGTAVLIVP